MAIFESFRRTRQSVSLEDSASVLSDRDSSSQASSKSRKSSLNPLKLAKTFSWKARKESMSQSSSTTDGSNDESPDGLVNTLDRPDKGVPSWLKKKNKKNKSPVHPRDKPLTDVNIRHQEMLSTFTFTFGNRRDSIGGRSSLHGGISPGTSRMPSMDGGSRPMPRSHPDPQLAQQHRLEHRLEQHDQFLSPSAAMGRRAALYFGD